jgi:protein-tyrosine phosphatase
MHQILFVCTGNYYRSRYAEAYFNHLAQEKKLPWLAFSRGLATHLAPPDMLSSHTGVRMKINKIGFKHTSANPNQISADDCDRARLIIALKQSEHEAMARKLLPKHVNRFQFWNISDVDETPPDMALKEIEQKVSKLVDQLSKENSLDK